MSQSSTPQRRLLPAGTVLDDRFEIVEALGAGSFGAVYRARQLIFGLPMRQVALKLFHADKVTRENVKDVFNDAVTLIGLQENNPSPEIASSMVQVYDIGFLQRPSFHAFLSMRLVPGRKTLETAVSRFGEGGMPVNLALGLLRQVLVPLAWMHAHEVVHGDLKPDNVLLTERSEVVLTDFGLAAHAMFGSVGGAIQYQAPETLGSSLAGNFHEVRGSFPADVYGAGLIWYEMLTGRYPFAGVDWEAVAAGGDSAAFVRLHYDARKWPMRALKPGEGGTEAKRIVPPSEINEEMREHPQLESLLESCLAYRQSDRPPNARVLLSRIDEYLRGGALPPPLRVERHPPAAERPESIDLGRKTPEKLLGDGEAKLASHDYEAAQALAKRILEQKPQWIPAMLLKARALLLAGRTEDARLVCSEAQGIDANNSKILETLADVYAAAGLNDRAERVRQQARAVQARPSCRPRGG